ncbi:MAG: S41 family peptidase [Nibricoccus sp.]
MALLLLSGCATAPKEYREPVALKAQDRAAVNLAVFDKAWTLTNENYFDPKFRGVDWNAMREKYRPEAEKAADDTALYSVLNHMCAEMKESHLHAASPRQSFERREEARAAVGMMLTEIEGKMVVRELVPGSPAEKAGVKPGWIVTMRNGSPFTKGESFVTRLGQPVTFEFFDEKDQRRTLVIDPALLTFTRLETRKLDGGFVYLRFDEFSKKTLSWLSEQLKEHAEAPGVIVDLRGNPGGNALMLSVSEAEFFPQSFPHGVANGTWISRSGNRRETSSFSWNSAHYRGRVVVLTSPGTASAAEIFSHVLQFHHRAIVVGERSAGAVISSRRYDLPDGGLIQIPVRDYVGLDGQRLEHRGVMPDHVVPRPTRAQLAAGEDPCLPIALDLLQHGPEPQFAKTFHRHRTE